MEQAALPVRLHADELLSAIRSNPVTVVIAETGSGKTTQLGQILLDAGLAGEAGCVAVTQPRRVAAVSVARRVASERSVQLGKGVGYCVRFDDCSVPSTRLRFLTDGCLLRECLADPNLRRYDVIILDEAHERSLATDVLFALTKALVASRDPPLKLVVTSATLDGDKFSSYFSNCPVVRVAGRCFPVDVAHSLDERKPSELVTAAIDTVWQVHTTQPPGDVLLFLTGAEEVDSAAKRLAHRSAESQPDECGPLDILTLYGALPLEMQARVFGARPPPGARRVVVATNIAETSLTVPGIVYVIDPGMVKQKEYDPSSGIERLRVVPISRVAAEQRAGRAGRTAAGKCFRLYTRIQARGGDKSFIYIYIYIFSFFWVASFV